MISRNRRWLGVVALVVFPSSADAQVIAHSFQELSPLLRVGQTIVVTDDAGRETKGKVADVAASSLVLLTPAPRTFAERSVTRVRATDSPWNGLLYGAGIGALWVVGSIAVGCDDDPEACANFAAHGTPLVMSLGAGVGLMIDLVVGPGRRLLFDTSQSGAPVVGLRPIVARGRTGVRLSVRF